MRTYVHFQMLSSTDSSDNERKEDFSIHTSAITEVSSDEEEEEHNRLPCLNQVLLPRSYA